MWTLGGCRKGKQTGIVMEDLQTKHQYFDQLCGSRKQ